MLTSTSEIYYTVIAVSILMLFLAIIVVIAVVKYQNKLRQNILEKASLKAQYEAEILNAENEIQEQTMRDISRELHDNVGQMLTLAKIQLNKLAEDSPQNKQVSNSKEFVQNALTDIRALSKTLNNENVLAEGLSKAIQFDLQRLERTGVFRTSFSDTYGGQMLDHKKEIVVFRTYQELVQNTLKHAQAKNISVALEENDQHFKLEIMDDGIGFNFSEKVNEKGFGGGAGLNNLVHRAKLLGGSLEWSPSSTGGTLAILTIPKLENS